MPTYEDLRTYFQQTESLQDAARKASSIPIVSGFVVDVDPLWSLLYDIENGLALPPDRPWPAPWGYPIDRYFDLLWNLSPLVDEPVSVWGGNRYQGYRRRNLHSKVARWDEMLSRFGPRKRFLPVTMTIVHRPLRAPAEPEEKGDDQEQLTRLLVLVAEFPIAVRVQERPPARLATGYGIASPNGKTGTLGGILKDSVNNKSYGVTCDHVANLGSTVDDGSGVIIGKCTASTARTPLRNATICDPVNLAIPSPFPGNGPDLNTLDCALIELSGSASCVQVAGVAARLTQGQNVVLHGATTHTTRHKLGSLGLSYTFKEGAQNFCFRDSIELVPQPRGPFGGPLGSMFSVVPTQGDSGGWVLTDDQPPDWAGLFFGEDGRRGFVIRASWVHDWAEKKLGRTLIF